MLLLHARAKEGWLPEQLGLRSAPLQGGRALNASKVQLLVIAAAPAAFCIKFSCLCKALGQRTLHVADASVH